MDPSALNLDYPPPATFSMDGLVTVVAHEALPASLLHISGRFLFIYRSSGHAPGTAPIPPLEALIFSLAHFNRSVERLPLNSWQLSPAAFARFATLAFFFA
jgi:hypothetical protein